MTVAELFGRRKTSSVIEQASTAETIAVPVPARMTVPPDDREFEAEYIALCEKLHIESPRPQTGDIRRLALAIEEEGLPCYDLETVRNFMEKKAAEASTGKKTYEWAWVPLRVADIPASWRASFNKRTEVIQIQQGYKGGLPFDLWNIYKKQIPKPVLITIDRLQQRVPDAQFVIADIIDVADPDPFLGVTMNKISKLFVIERWDEPNFRDLGAAR